jgi:hypothetical protein
MGLNIGYLTAAKAGHTFTLLIDLLESRGYLKILMNPTLEVVNGGTAKVMSSQKVPLDRITMRSTQSDYLETKTDYEDVIDSLEVTAHVYGDGYIGLETSVLLGSKNTPEGVKQVPIITKKQIDNKQNRIRQGESLIIGGIRKNEEYAVVRGVPILKDIPIIGFLFSSEDTEQRAVETIFILTPSISTDGRPKEVVMKEVQRKHEPDTPSISTDGRPKEVVMKEVQRKHEPDTPSGLGEMISDPFGLRAREKASERSRHDAEQARLEAEVEKAQARIDIREAEERAQKAEEELSRVETEAQKIKSDAEKSNTEAEAKAKAADKAIADAKKAQEEANKIKAEAEAKIKAAEESKKEEPKPKAEAKKPAPKTEQTETQKAQKAEVAKAEEEKA